MNRSLLRFSFIFIFAIAITGCESLQGSAGSTDSENAEAGEQTSEEGQNGSDPSTSTAPADQGSDDTDTATDDADRESGGDSGEGSGPNEADWDEENEDGWGDGEDSWDDGMDGTGPGAECFQACEMALEENLYACNPDGEWEGDEGEMPLPPPEEPQADPEESEESEEEPTDPSDGWGGDDECTEQAFEEFHGCIELCNEEHGWDGPHPGPLDCPERCDYFAEDVMWMCMENVGNEEECAELSEHAHMICMDECPDGPGDSGGPDGPGDDCPDYSPPNCGEDQHVEWYEDEMGCSHPECVPNDEGDDGVVGVFECGEQACAMWQEYCQVTYPGQPQGEIQYQCLGLPNDCNDEQGYCSCIEVVQAGAGSCEEDPGVVYVTVYAP